MAGKDKSTIIPEEYVLKNKEYDINEWRKQKIADALKYQEERQTGADVPKWWEGTEEDPYYSPKYRTWNNCLATATGSFGEKYCETGNETFINPNSDGYFVKRGFRELTEADTDEYGDIWVDNRTYDNTPHHALMLTGHDEKGEPLFTYGSGWRDGIKKGVHYPFENLGKKYRFVGTPDEIAQIETHNAKVRELQKETAPLREKREVTRLNVEPLVAAEPITDRTPKKSLMAESVEKYLKKKKAFE